MATKKTIDVSEGMMTNESGEFDFGMFSEIEDDVRENKPSLSNIPLLKLEQNMSPEVTDRNYPDIYAGTIVNDETKEVVGGTEEDKVTLTVRVLKARRERIKFPPRESGNFGVECSCPTYHSNGQEDWGNVYGECRTCKFSPFGVKDGCRQQYLMVVCDANDPSKLYRLILSKTSYKGAQQFEKDWLEVASPIHKKTGKYPPLFVLPVEVYGKKVIDKRHNSSYYVFDLQVKAFTGMSKELALALKDTRETVNELFDASIEFHNSQVEALKAAKSTDPEPQAAAREEAYEALDSAFSETDNFVVPGSDEEVPF